MTVRNAENQPADSPSHCEYVALVAAADMTGNYGVCVLLKTCLADKLAFAERTEAAVLSLAAVSAVAAVTAVVEIGGEVSAVCVGPPPLCRGRETEGELSEVAGCRAELCVITQCGGW